MVYTARGNRMKGFTITDEGGSTLGNIAYKGWFTRRADIYLFNNDHYQVVPSGFWLTTFDITHAEYSAGQAKRRWGVFNISMNNTDYVYKRRGLWGRQFVMQTMGQDLFSVKQKFDWTKFNMVYEVNIAGIRDPQMILLFLLAIYFTNQQYAGAGAT